MLELEQRIDVPGRYFGRKILGRVTLNDQKTRDEIGNAFRAATSEPENIAVACFFPRHGIRIEHEFHRIDLLICFECFTVYVYRDGLQIDGMKTTDAAAPVFDRVLEAAGIPLAKKKGE